MSSPNPMASGAAGSEAPQPAPAKASPNPEKKQDEAEKDDVHPMTKLLKQIQDMQTDTSESDSDGLESISKKDSGEDDKKGQAPEAQAEEGIDAEQVAQVAAML